MKALSDLLVGQRGIIASVEGEPGLVQRFLELGLMEGAEVEVLALAPLGDPIEVRTGNSRLSMRRREAAGIHLQPASP